MTRCIDSALTTKGGNFINVKFADGTECVAPVEREYAAPIESGVEAFAVAEQRESGGRQFELLVFWGPKHVWEMQNAAPNPESRIAQNEAAVAAQAPLVPKRKPEPKVYPFDLRELSIMAQVAMKEAVPYAAQKVAMGKSKNLDTPAQIVKTARTLLKGMLDMALDAREGAL